MNGNNGQIPNLIIEDDVDKFKSKIRLHIQQNEYFDALKDKPFVNYKFYDNSIGNSFSINVINTCNPDTEIVCGISHVFFILNDRNNIRKYILSKFYSDEMLEEFKEYFDDKIKMMYEEYMSTFDKTKSARK